MTNSFLYAFDKNYEKQGSVSIFSLLENVNKKINIFVLTENSSENLNFPETLLKHKNLNFLKVKNISINDKLFNLKEAHVSRATFYRLYLSQVFGEDEFDIVYLDADIICISNPLEKISSTFNEMKNLNLNFAGLDEFYNFQNKEPFLRLGMQSDKYFNAGVMLINLKGWNEDKISAKSIESISKLKQKAIFWDQDILNSVIDGKYYSFSPSLNYKTSKLLKNKLTNDDVIFIHFSGKGKPWDAGGIFEDLAFFYHNFYYKLYQKKFHVVTVNRKNSIIKLLKNSKNFYRLNIFDLLIYFFKTINSIFKKKEL